MSKQKPFEVAYKDFTDTLITIVNNSELPPLVIALAMKDVLNEVNKLSEAQYQAALTEYNKPEEQQEEGEEVDG